MIKATHALLMVSGVLGNNSNNGSGDMTNDAKNALLAILEKVAYVNENGQTYYDALETALYPPADLVSISAVFNQGSAVIYDTDSLDTLKQYLTVTALYSDSTSEVVTTYTLSGTLTEGTSTITVSYGGKTTTFTVTVVHAKSDMDGWTDGVAYTDLTIVNNSYVTKAAGTITAYNGWDRTGYVPCDGALVLIFPPMPQSSESGDTASSNWFYGANNAPVSQVTLSKTKTKRIAVPSNATHFIISSDSAALASCISGGIVPTMDASKWEDDVPYSNIEVVEDSYVAASTGNITAAEGWNRTGYMPCYGATQIDFPALPQVSGTANSAWFYNLTYGKVQNISLSKTQSTTISVPENAAFFIISSEAEALATFLGGDIVPHA